MEMTAVILALSFCLTILKAGALACTNPLMPTRVGIYNKLPDFLGNSTIPDSCTALPCFLNTLNDGVKGDSSQMVNSSQFIALKNGSRVVLTVAGTNTVDALRSITIYYYYDPLMGYPLPEFIISGSNSDIDTGTTNIPYTFLNNQDLSFSEPQVRNTTIVLVDMIENSNRLHFEYPLMSDQLFVLSEIELCTDEVVLAGESLSVRQSSGPSELVASGSTLLVPANRTRLNGSYTLSCTIVNQGRFQWEWIVPDSVSVTPVILDGTRTSVIVVPQSVSSVGEYNCTARYHPDTGLNSEPANARFLIDFELILYTTQTEVERGNSLVFLDCILAGAELSAAVNLEWSLNGNVLANSMKYVIVPSADFVCDYGRCHHSLLQIRNPNPDDDGVYTCSYNNNSQEITVVPVSPTTASSPTPSTASPTSPQSGVLPVIIGVAGGGGIAIVIVTAVILICCCCNRRMRTTKLKPSPIDTSEDESDNLYQVIPKKDIPPPLPTRPPPGTGAYATVDTKMNGHLELTNLSSEGAPRDSVISMPADMNGSSNDRTLAKLTGTANGQGLNLRNNPLYSSADNLISNPPPVPDKAYTSSPGMLAEESHLNIYAIPNKPPPLPARMASPDFKEGSPDPIYTEAGLSPTQFRTPNPVLSPSQFQVTTPSSTSSPEGSTKICPYASIYADPQPLKKEEGPMEVRPYHIKQIRQLGTGQFGEVMLAETQGISEVDLKIGNSTDKSVGILVAVKRLKQNAEKVVKEAFEKEIKFMARLNHINVIRMLAICPTGQPFILMEYMEFGDLNQYLQKFEVAPSDSEPTEKQIAVASLLYACLQISNGMRYLASLHFIHRDLATRNFLVGKDQVIKIADFGMSRSLYSSHYYRIQGRAILPIRWMANECFYGRFSEKTDVWAFGVAMWEVFMLAKVQPYDELSDQQVIENAVNPEKTKLLTRPQHCPEEVYEVMLQCWEKDPEKRINFEDVYSSLAALHSYSDL